MAAQAEAIGRLISYSLRLKPGITPEERLVEIADQLANIGGRRSTGFGAEKVYSMPDGVSRGLLKDHVYFVENSEGRVEDNGKPDFKVELEVCPECHEYTYAHTEGCDKCLACGHSSC